MDEGEHKLKELFIDDTKYDFELLIPQFLTKSFLSALKNIKTGPINFEK